MTTNFKKSVSGQDLLRSIGELALHDRIPKSAKAAAQLIYGTMLDCASKQGFTSQVELEFLLSKADRGYRTRVLSNQAVASLGGDARIHTLFGLLLGDFGPVDRVIRDFNQKYDAGHVGAKQ